MDWQANLKSSTEDLKAIVASTQRIAVLGIKTEAQADQPAFYVPEHMHRAGFTIIPVPVFYPEATHILGQPVYRRLAEVPPPVDMVNVFRRPESVPGHLEDLLACKPKVVWMQSGIRHAEVAERLAREGVLVVQDACLMVVARLMGR